METIHNDEHEPPSLVQDDTRQSFSDYDDEDPGLHVHLASVAEKKRLWWRNAAINSMFIASWFTFAIIISVYNKWMFSPSHLGFPYPLLVTTLHMLVQFGMSATIRAVWPERFKPKGTPRRADYGKKVVPTAVATSLDIGLSNLSLKTITLSFYTMCKSSSLIFVLLFAFIFRLELFSFRLVGVIFLIFSGVVLMVATETHFVLSGFLLVLSASASGGLRWSLTQVLLKSRKMGLDNPAATIFWLSPVMTLTLAVASAVVEGWWQVFRSKFFESWWAVLTTMVYLIAPGVIAFCMVMSEFYIIQRAGVVPMSIAGIAKEVATITISAWFFGDELTPLNITGVAITVCGIGLFTYHKYRKSIDSTVPLDGHGNPVPLEDEDDEAGGDDGYFELGDTDRFTALDSSSMGDVHELGGDDVPHKRSLFSAAHEGEEDAEELRSIRSSKMRLAVGTDPPRRAGTNGVVESGQADTQRSEYSQ